MAGIRLTVTVDDDRAREALARLAARGRDLTPVMKVIGQTLRTSAVKNFETGGGAPPPPPQTPPTPRGPQKPHHRGALWVALAHGVIIELDGKVIPPDKNAELWLPAGSVHRLSCDPLTPHPVRVLEISLGHFDENDIERLEDVYGRP